MDLTKEIKTTNKKIFNFLDKKLNQYKKIFLEYSDEKLTIINLFQRFIKNGKGIRGSLVFLTNEFFEGEKINQKNLFYLSGFFEIMHSSLLIHDDIMDQDKYRRGQKTINFYFQEKIKKISSDSFHTANSLAINIGDIGFFIGFDLLNKISLEEKIKNKLINFLMSEYIKVALAQMDDVLYSKTEIKPKLKNIKKIYLYKTARYTFVLPIISTLLVKKNPFYQNSETIKILEKLGILFQITDDLIGFLSDETGKDLGSDIRENKKTLIYYYLIKELENNQIKNFFGKNNLTKEEVIKIRQFYHQSKTKKIIDSLIEKFKKEIKNTLKKQNFPQEFKDLIINFIEFLIKRKK